MKVDKILYSCDGSYYPFWKYVSEITTKILKITPVLFFINNNEETDFYEDEFGVVKKIKTKDLNNTGFLGQICRLYGTKFFKNEVCLISDLDMILFNKNWLENILKDIDENEFVLLNSDAYESNRMECKGMEVRYPICYYVGKGELFDKILNTDRTFEDFSEDIKNTKRGWDNDEVFFTQKLLHTEHGVKYHPIKRGYSSLYYAPGRIEKYMFEEANYRGEVVNRMYKLNLNGTINYDTFIDCHISRSGLPLLEKIKNDLINFYK